MVEGVQQGPVLVGTFFTAKNTRPKAAVLQVGVLAKIITI